MDQMALLHDLVSLVGPPGQEEAIVAYLQRAVGELGLSSSVDPKGNLLVQLGDPAQTKVVVTAHMDEIAMLVTEMRPDGRLKVAALGGMKAWKLGEGPVSVLCKEPIDGVFSFGSIHTASPSSVVRRADHTSVAFEDAWVETGLSLEELTNQGVRPGTRVVVHPSRRGLTKLGDLVSGFFLDDRADLVSWLLALDQLKSERLNVLFAATASEEIGGEGALYLLNKIQPDVCIALELGPHVLDAPLVINDQPTVWVKDSYAAMKASDGELLADLGSKLGLNLQFQALSRGGSDASCAASHGLCARPITLGLPMENTHGYEIMHPNAMANLATLTVALIKEIS